MEKLGQFKKNRGVTIHNISPSFLTKVIRLCEENLFAVTILISSAWVFAFMIHSIILDTSLISWVFIPSGLKLVLFMIYRSRAILGMLVGGSTINFLLLKMVAVKAILTGAICALSPILAIFIFERLMSLRVLNQKMSWFHFVFLALIFSITNALCHNFFFNAAGLMNTSIQSSIKMVIGDLAGILITIVIMVKIRKKISQA